MLLESLIYLLSRGVHHDYRKIPHERPAIIEALRLFKHTMGWGAHISTLQTIQYAWDESTSSKIVFTYHMLLCANTILDAFHRLTGQHGAVFEAWTRNHDRPSEREPRSVVRVRYSRNNAPVVTLHESMILPTALEQIVKAAQTMMSQLTEAELAKVPDVLRESSSSNKSRASARKEQGKKLDDDGKQKDVKKAKIPALEAVDPAKKPNCKKLLKENGEPTVTVAGTSTKVCLRSCCQTFSGCAGHPDGSGGTCKFFHLPSSGAVPSNVDLTGFKTWLVKDKVKEWIKLTDKGKELLGDL